MADASRTFRPVDSAARTGQSLLLSNGRFDHARRLYAGRWCRHRRGFVFSSGQPIEDTITHYSPCTTFSAAGGPTPMELA